MKKLELESVGFRNCKPIKKHQKQILGSGQEISLPHEIIQRIQSFLNGKEAAASSILSKSWHDAWLTRPDLDLNQYHFPCGGVEQLLDMTKKTIQRHEDCNLTIDTLRLLMDTQLSHHTSVAKNLLAKAMKLVVVDLDITLWMNPSFVLPVEVLRSETLARLSLHGGLAFDLADLTCPKLKSLCVTAVPVTGDIFRDLIARHPLIERVKLDLKRRRSFALSGGESERMSSSVNNWIDLQDDQFEFHKLEYMSLGQLILEGNLFIRASATRFPFLKELVIWNCIPKSWDYRDMRISSTSLERITIGFVDEDDSIWTWGPDHNWNAEFDVPNIRKFEFEGCAGSVIALKATSREWESNICVRCYRPTTEWFISLNQLLQKFSLSKVCLSIDFSTLYERFEMKNMNIGVLAAACLHVPVELECLRIEGYELSPAVFNVLFLICRPKMIILHCLEGELIDGLLLELVCRRLIEEVNLEVFEEDCDEWQFVPWKSILDAPTHEHRLVRFQLKWRLELSAPK